MHTEKNPASACAGTFAAPARAAGTSAPAVRRLTSAGLMQDQRELEIEHGNKIYRLRITQLGKLILTA